MGKESSTKSIELELVPLSLLKNEEMLWHKTRRVLNLEIGCKNL